ncbi:hypothetical protein CVS27_17165 [Arthrobacter glacialis]|uniref:Tn3 transposase DDE domain-containing protein n=1 Tax=Arthrobacter glacialis TaxID=1664 RepID=A0A2S3ZT12_ARTGL|nr:hypothetical protein CVS27_17165 [Arthrobacter glacialis]
MTASARHAQAIQTTLSLDKDGKATDPELLRFLSPRGWEHINLTSDYTRCRANHIKPCKYGALRSSTKP